MSRVINGKAWVFDGLLDVDWEICSFDTFLSLREKGQPVDYEGLGKYCMVNLDPDFPTKVQPGDFIVAGENMGYGHDHDHACKSIKGSGVGAVLCESTNSYFLRNSLDHGLPVIEVPGIKNSVGQGERLELDLERGTVKSLDSDTLLEFNPYPEFLLEMLDKGGLYPLLEERVKAGELG